MQRCMHSSKWFHRHAYMCQSNVVANLLCKAVDQYASDQMEPVMEVQVRRNCYDDRPHYTWFFHALVLS